MTKAHISEMLASFSFNRSSAVIHLPGHHIGNLGYGFLWFHQADDAHRFKEIAVGYKFPDSNSTKRLDVTLARIQDAKPYRHNTSNVIGYFQEEASWARAGHDGHELVLGSPFQ